MKQPRIPDPWRCADCGTQYPIPTLARDCERRHEVEKELYS